MSRYLGDEWALPYLDPQTRPFFTSGAIRIQVCRSCDTPQHPPDDVCHACQGMEFTHRDSAGLGTVHSYIVVHHAVHPALAERVPYAVALIALDDMPTIRVCGNIVDSAPDDVSIGQQVRVVFEEIHDAEADEDLTIPQWETLTS